MTRYLTGGLAAAIAMLPTLALAHAGHAAPTTHIHWEIVGLVVVAIVSVALVIRARRH